MKRVLMILLACLLILPARAETVQDQALAFIQDAGIEADAVTRVENDVIVTMMNGGTAVLHLESDFDKYNLGWTFRDSADEDVALYLDHALTLLSVLEAKIPADTASLSAAEVIRVRSWAAIVDKALDSMTVLGEQGLRILQEQLEVQEDCELNNLRERLMVRIQEALLAEAEAIVP